MFFCFILLWIVFSFFALINHIAHMILTNKTSNSRVFFFFQNERVNKEEEGKKVQLALDKANVELIEKEEGQFQEYARKVYYVVNVK